MKESIGCYRIEFDIDRFYFFFLSVAYIRRKCDKQFYTQKRRTHIPLRSQIIQVHLKLIIQILEVLNVELE